jgi:hypothetical protein
MRVLEFGGAEAAFILERIDNSQSTDVSVIPASGSALAKISGHGFDGVDASQRWSRDGKQFILPGQTERHQFPRFYVADASGGGVSQLTVKDIDLIPTRKGISDGDGDLWWAQRNVRSGLISRVSGLRGGGLGGIFLQSM